MPDPVSTLNAWDNFYVIVGSAGAALTGLMFVVVTLMSESTTGASEEGVSAFATPNVVHFCATLLVSAIMTAPWTAVWQAAWALGLAGFAGLFYLFVTILRARRQTAYTPVFQDWLWHFVLPFAAYGTLAGAGLIATVHAGNALFAVAAATTLLLFASIHNAWDTVTYMALQRLRARQKKKEAQAAEAARAARGSEAGRS